MKILFVINDGDARRMEYEYTGVLNAPNRRAVEIELTSEQVEKIGIRKIGVSSGKDVMETIESISLVVEKITYKQFGQEQIDDLYTAVLSPGLEYPDAPGKWRMEEYYQKAIEDEPRNHVSHWNVWERKDGVLMASNDDQTDPVKWLGCGNQRWIRED